MVAQKQVPADQLITCSNAKHVVQQVIHNQHFDFLCNGKTFFITSLFLRKIQQNHRVPFSEQGN